MEIIKCPNCEYINGWNWIGDEWVEVETREGVFFKMPLKAEKNIDCYDQERLPVYGCPRCGVMFMDTNYDKENYNG